MAAIGFRTAGEKLQMTAKPPPPVVILRRQIIKANSEPVDGDYTLRAAAMLR